MPWKPGQSGNPRGPKPLSERVSLRDYITKPTPSQIQEFAKVVWAKALDPNSIDWRVASKYVLEYNLGLPKSTVEVVADSPFAQLLGTLQAQLAEARADYTLAPEDVKVLDMPAPAQE